MSTNEKINTPKWKKIISKLKSSIQTRKSNTGLNTEIDYYRHYVYPTKLEDKITAVVSNIPENRSTKA